MSTKAYVWIFSTVGSIIGGYVPALWGASFFSLSSLLCSGIGGVIGILAGYKIGSTVNG